MFILFLLNLSFLTFAQECVDGAYQVKIPLPDKTIEFCQVSKDGKLLKHGKEGIYGPDGKLIEENFYVYGEKRSSPPPAADLPSIINSHGEVLNKNKDTNTRLAKKNYTFNTFWHMIFLHHAPHPVIQNEIKSDGCPDHTAKLIKMILSRIPHSFNYLFTDDCDVQGAISVDEKLNALLDLEVRKYGPYNHAKANGRLKISNQNMAIKIVLEIEQASLNGPQGETTFSAQYELLYEPLRSKNTLQGVGGQIQYKKIFDKTVEMR